MRKRNGNTERNPKFERNDENQEKPVLMEDFGNL